MIHLIFIKRVDDMCFSIQILKIQFEKMYQ